MVLFVHVDVKSQSTHQSMYTPQVTFPQYLRYPNAQIWTTWKAVRLGNKLINPGAFISRQHNDNIVCQTDKNDQKWIITHDTEALHSPGILLQAIYLFHGAIKCGGSPGNVLYCPATRKMPQGRGAGRMPSLVVWRLGRTVRAFFRAQDFYESHSFYVLTLVFC